jgi:hypothetical protein
MSGKILDFRPVTTKSGGRDKTGKQQKSPEAVALKLLRISDEIDAVILHHVESGNIDIRDLAGLLSHRLGTLMNHIEDKKDLLPLCMRVLKKQAKVD